VVRHARASYEQRYPPTLEQGRLLRRLVQCRTSALGAHKTACDRCGHEEIAYNSCRDRHCPKCQASSRARWLERQRRDLLPVPYFHLVFTLPPEVGRLAPFHRRAVYGMLFAAVARTLTTLARDPKYLGAELGWLAVLHTWGQRLQLHPHLHCLVPAGGLSPDGTHWIAAPHPRFLFPVRLLSRLFRKNFLALLQRAWPRSGLDAATDGPPDDWALYRQKLLARDWVVYVQPPWGGPDLVLKYLARYVHRVAIANERLVALQGGKISFRWRDSAHGRRERTLQLETVEFVRRFLRHQLPRAFRHIRHYGFLANRAGRARREALLRTIPAVPPPAEPAEPTPAAETAPRCPLCGTGRMLFVALLVDPAAAGSPRPIRAPDSS